ncbi:MAG: fixL4 [Holophagaceae bacterium]|nr:fixL4 [Holophagaceae bacterium]
MPPGSLPTNSRTSQLSLALARLEAEGVALPSGPAWDRFLSEMDTGCQLVELHPCPDLLQYRSLVDHLKEVVFQIDREGSWSLLNPAWTTIMGFPLEESLGQPFLGYMHPEDTSRYMNLLTYALETSQDIIRGEFRFVTREGQPRWVEMYNRVTVDGNGTVTGVTGTLNDITERRRAETALATITSRLMALLENMQAGILVETQDRRIALLNETFCRMFDVPVPAHMLTDSPATELLEMCLPLAESPSTLQERLQEIHKRGTLTRDPDPHERRHRHDGPAAPNHPQRRADGLRHHHPFQCHDPPAPHQRHPRLFQDRGRQDGVGEDPFRPPGTPG